MRQAMRRMLFVSQGLRNIEIAAKKRTHVHHDSKLKENKTKI